MYQGIFFLLFLLCRVGFSQDYSFHRSTLDTSVNPVLDHNLVREYGETNANLILWNNKIKSLKEKKDSIFFSDRKYLTKIPLTDTSLVHKGGSFSFENIKDSVSLDVEFFLTKDNLNLNTFHGSRFFDSFKIKKIRFSIAGNNFNVMESHFEDLYEIWSLTRAGRTVGPIELYQSKNKRYYYLYIHGGSETSWYLSKFVFSNNGFETRIIVDYYDYVTSGGMFERYIGI
jgi:hypothetical protein